MRHHARQRLLALIAGEQSWRGAVRCVAGLDEAGRGPIAGPVFAAAVILPDDPAVLGRLVGIDDSKRLREAERERLYLIIGEIAAGIGVGSASPAEIDEVNILQATYLAMHRALKSLPTVPDLVLIDGNPAPPFGLPQQSIVKGDSICLSISAAGIVAKVTRDREMRRLHQTYPPYRFDIHKGYGTAYHLAAIGAWGITPQHRRSFALVRCLPQTSAPSAAFRRLWETIDAIPTAAVWVSDSPALAEDACRLAWQEGRAAALALWQRAKDLNVPPAQIRSMLAALKDWLPAPDKRGSTPRFESMYTDVVE